MKPYKPPFIYTKTAPLAMPVVLDRKEHPTVLLGLYLEKALAVTEAFQLKQAGDLFMELAAFLTVYGRILNEIRPHTLKELFDKTEFLLGRIVDEKGYDVMIERWEGSLYAD